MRVGIILAVTFGLALPAAAHTEAEQREWVDDWQDRVAANGVLTRSLVAEYVDFQKRHAPPPPRSPQRSTVSNTSRRMGSNVEQWRPLVARHFSDVDQALCIMSHESGGNPNAKNATSSARGLFQILASLWAPHYGVSYDALYDPELNVRLAADIYAQQGWWAWSPYRRGLCR